MSTTISEKIQSLKSRLLRHHRSLNYLEEQIAVFGGSTAPVPLHLLHERDFNRAEIARLETELEELEAEVASAPLVTPPGFLPPQVRLFISANPGLEAERQVVKDALARLTLPGVRVKVTGSQSVSRLEITRLIEQECDLFLALYGAAYGTPLPGEYYSATEIELDVARKMGKPILIYRKDDVQPDADQAAFLEFIKNLENVPAWQDFSAAGLPDELTALVQQDILAEIERRPEWQQRPSVPERVLLASLGLSPGAVVGLYDALNQPNQPVTRVITFCPANREAREAVGLCRDEFERRGVPYTNRFLDAEDISSDGDAKEFKGMFSQLLQDNLDRGAEVLVGITGGRTIMGALMAIVVQTVAPERVSMYHLDVDYEIARDGQLPELWKYESDPHRWAELLSPPPEKRRLVQVPYVRHSKPTVEQLSDLNLPAEVL